MLVVLGFHMGSQMEGGWRDWCSVGVHSSFKDEQTRKWGFRGFHRALGGLQNMGGGGVESWLWGLGCPVGEG